jgi:prevent-host-death family protein
MPSGPGTSISQRDLRNWSAQIMDRVESGECFTITRKGQPVARLTPLEAPRREVPSAEAVTAFSGIACINHRQMRAEIDQQFEDSGDRFD